MDHLIAELFDLISDEIDQTEVRQAGRRAESHYAMLCQTLGVEQANAAWDAAVAVGSAEVEPAFRSGLFLGIRLMAAAMLN